MPMTPEEVAAWLRGQGVAEGVIADEAGYVSGAYADPDEDPMAALQASLGGYLQRSASGGDRATGGYSTNYDDPAVGTAPPRTDSPFGFQGQPAPSALPPGVTFGSQNPQGDPTGANEDRLNQLFDEINTDLMGAGRPMVDVPGINLNEDIDASLLSVMRGTDTGTQETNQALRQLLADVGSAERPEIPTRTLATYDPLPERRLPTRGLGDFYDQDRVTRRMLTATENAQLAQQGLLSQMRAQLGDAGTIGLPGAPQGPETAGARRVTERVGVPFAQELSEIQNVESERALDAAMRHFGLQSERDVAELSGLGQRDIAERQSRTQRDVAELDAQTRADIARQEGFDVREQNALQLATGWSSAQAARVLQAAAAGTDRQRMLSEIALGSLDRNMRWNQFLAEFGLDRERFMQDVRQGNMQNIGAILMQFQQFLSQLRGGFIGG